MVRLDPAHRDKLYQRSSRNSSLMDLARAISCLRTFIGPAPACSPRYFPGLLGSIHQSEEFLRPNQASHWRCSHPAAPVELVMLVVVRLTLPWSATGARRHLPCPVPSRTSNLRSRDRSGNSIHTTIRRRIPISLRPYLPSQWQQPYVLRFAVRVAALQTRSRAVCAQVQ